MSQRAAMAILVQIDPGHALELLHQMEAEDAATGENQDPLPQNPVVMQVFQALARQDGENALPTLEREAAVLGSQGHYPYSALGYAAQVWESGSWRGSREHAVEVEQAVLEVAFAQYRQAPHTYLQDVDFGRMLQILAGGLALESVRPPLHLLVQNLLATDAGKYRYTAAVFTKDGQSAKADNAIDAALLWLGPLINRDAELASQLSATRPQLQTGLEYTKSGEMRSSSFGGMPAKPNAPPPRGPSPAAEARMDAVRLSHINPDLAIASAEKLPAGPERTGALLEVARGIAGNDPDRAAQVIAESTQENAAGENDLQLNLISAKASVAAAKGNRSELRDLLQQGLASVSGLAADDSKRSFGGVGGLVQIGIQYEPEMTTAFLRALPSSPYKANLLFEAAAALSLHQRLPLRTSAPPRPQPPQ